MSAARGLLQRLLARSLRTCAPLRFALNIAIRLLAPRHRVGVLAMVARPGGALLLAAPVVRPQHPWGLPGGWIARGEQPPEAVRRELREELGIEVAVESLLTAVHTAERGGVSGLTLVYRCTVGATVTPRSSLSWELLGSAWLTPEQALARTTGLEHELLRTFAAAPRPDGGRSAEDNAASD